MPRFMSAIKVVGSFMSNKTSGVRQLTRFAKHNQIRCLSSFNSTITEGIHGSKSARDFDYSMVGSCCNNVQRRHFLGVGDGDQAGVLSKVYEEKIVMGYSPEQLFNVVAAVDLYYGFVPWCQRSEITKYYPDGSFDAELEIGFKFFVESYVSHVELERAKFVKTTVSQSSLFDHLINLWEFKPGPVAGSCDLYFLVDFKFQSPLYRQMASLFFKEVVTRLVGSFSDRCRLVYGPGVRVHENTYGQRS